MTNRFLAASFFLLLATPAFGDSVVFDSRKATDGFWNTCLSPAERATAHITGRKSPLQDGFTIFFDQIGVFACTSQTPEVCAQRCDGQQPASRGE